MGCVVTMLSIAAERVAAGFASYVSFVIVFFNSRVSIAGIDFWGDTQTDRQTVYHTQAVATTGSMVSRVEGRRRKKISRIR